MVYFSVVRVKPAEEDTVSDMAKDAAKGKRAMARRIIERKAAVTAAIEKGTRIRFMGDFANEESLGTVTLVEDGYFSALLDNGQKIHLTPLALLSTPRYKVIT